MTDEMLIVYATVLQMSIEWVRRATASVARHMDSPETPPGG